MKKVQFSNFKHKVIFFRVFTMLCFVMLILNAVVSVKLGGKMLSVGEAQIPGSSLNGCIQAVMALIGIILVLTDHKKGLVVFCIVMGLSIVGVVRTIIVTQKLSIAPGAFNAVIFIIAIALISGQIKYSNKMAETDSTTGLLNRYAFDRDMRKVLWQGGKGCVAFIRIEGFSPVNANLGRRYVDELKNVVADRISSVIDSKCTAYKIESAEYAVIFPKADDVETVIDRTLHSIEQAITLNKDGVDSNCYLTAYAGIADYGESAKDADTVMKHADIAMNYAVKSGTVKYCRFNDELKEGMERQTVVENMVKDSLQNGWFYLVYQPQYTAEDKRLRGFETLIRMNVPNGEKIAPSEFISIAEMSDLVLDIDTFVLDRAMREFREVCYSSGNTITLAVNISAKDIARSGFAEKLLGIIEETQFPPECLEVEITEYSFAEEGNRTIENIKILRDNQIMIALDDFGTGYTSLGQLMNLPINLVKIDKSLIDNILRNDVNTDFVKSIIYMGHLMDAEVIAEGVEHDNQVECLKTLDCDFIQGYIWGRPMEYDEARELAFGVYDRSR